MGSLSVAEAAERLGVGVARVHQRIADGSLPAQRIGSQWVLDEASLFRVMASRPGRPLSARSVWALVGHSRGDAAALAALAPQERSRARDRLEHLLGLASGSVPVPEERSQEVLSLLQAWFRNRASRRLFRVSRRDLASIRSDGRLVLSGLSHPSSGIASGDVAEAYVLESELESLVHDHLLSAVAVEEQANVFLHVAPDRRGIDVVAPLLVAVDLAEHRRPREEGRAIELLRSIAHSPGPVG